MQLTKRITPPALAEAWGIDVGKVLSWIKSGELRAIDGATRRGQRPRYLIDVADLEAFERSRSVTPHSAPVPRRRRSSGQVTEFF